MNVIAYDFDGTITKKDTFLDFSMYSKGKLFTIFSFCLYFPLIILAKLRLYSNEDVKQKVFSFLYKGMSIDSFNQKCVEYANCVSDKIIKEDALRSIRFPKLFLLSLYLLLFLIYFLNCSYEHL